MSCMQTMFTRIILHNGNVRCAMCDGWMGTNHVYINEFCILHKADVHADEKRTTNDDRSLD